VLPPRSQTSRNSAFNLFQERFALELDGMFTFLANIDAMRPSTIHEQLLYE
jgi:hypothetical protein